MQTKVFKKGDIIHKSGDIAESLLLVVKGSVQINIGNVNVELKKGSILGLLESAGAPYSYDYTALEDTICTVYPFTRFSDVDKIVEDSFSTCDVLITAFASTMVSLATKYRRMRKECDNVFNTIKSSYQKYKEICSTYNFEIQSFPFLETTSEFVPSKEMPDWVSDFYDQLEIMPKEFKIGYFSAHTSLVTATLWEAASHASLYLSLCDQLNSYANESLAAYFDTSSGDIIDLYVNLYTKAKSSDAPLYIYSDIDNAVNLFFNGLAGVSFVSDAKLLEKRDYYDSITEDNQEITEAISDSGLDEITGSLDKILAYASMDEAEEERFKELVSEYKMLRDKNSLDDDVRKLRSDLAKYFFDIYEAAIVSAFESTNVPTILKMFFYFGYMDEDLVGKENALKLYKLVETLEKSSSDTVLTAYDWLYKIYTGQEEPSKNEFELTYPAFLKEQKSSGYITEEMMERYLNSNKEKLRFELRNFFKLGLKITSPRPTTFCPILSDHNIIKPLEDIMVTADAVMNNWDSIRDIDYSLFYRECSLQAPEYGIAREPIQLEVFPYVVLMPSIGQRASLWQETSSVRRDSRGRIVVPIFANEDLLSLQMKVAGDFRWELCKRIQGSRWNDVTDRSLTSEYFDYLQFYRKNSDLSADAKEKIRNAITNAKNSFKNVFIVDYIIWLKYESGGSPRLNKVSKAILFTYCPFAKKYRDKLKSNPMYTDIINRHEAMCAKKTKGLELHYNKVAAANDGRLPEEIKKYIEFYSL